LSYFYICSYGDKGTNNIRNSKSIWNKLLKIYIFTHSGGAEVALGEIPETTNGFGDFLYFTSFIL